MMKPKMVITGKEIVVKNLSLLPAKAINAVAKATLTAAILTTNDAKILSPVDRGRLRASLSFNWTDSGIQHGKIKGKVKPKAGSKGSTPQDGVGPPPKELKGFHASVGTNVEYAEDVENNISPFLWPAFAMNKEKYRTMLSAALRTELSTTRLTGGSFFGRPNVRKL